MTRDRHARSDRVNPRGDVAVIGCCAALLAGCLADTSHLSALGVRTQESNLGWFRFRTAEYSFEMPGVPLAEREQYGFGGHRIDTLFFDLGTGANWRVFLVRAFDARSLSESDREAVRVEAEQQMARAGRGTRPRPTLHRDGAPVHEILVEGMNRADWSGLVRTSVRGGWVFQQTVIFDAGDGDWSDLRYFLDSLRIEGRAAAAPAEVPLEVDE